MESFDQAGNEAQIFEMLKKQSEGHVVLLTLSCMKDLAADRFYPPRGSNTEREATRDFKELVEKDPYIKNNAHDYELYQVGLFNPKTGESTAIRPIRLARALDFVKV